jgi:hypothetical protein
LPVKKRQLQKKLKEHTNQGGRYLCAFIKKEISAKNREERVAYGKRHKDASFDNIVFTDEAHIDPAAQTQGRVLREQGTRYNPENIQERKPLKGVRLHIAAWISWEGKAENLSSTTTSRIRSKYLLTLLNLVVALLQKQRPNITVGSKNGRQANPMSFRSRLRAIL